MRPDEDVDQFCADAIDFGGEGVYPQFLKFMAERGYSEKEVEKLTDLANKRAGRG